MFLLILFPTRNRRTTLLISTYAIFRHMSTFLPRCAFSMPTFLKKMRPQFLLWEDFKHGVKLKFQQGIHAKQNKNLNVFSKIFLPRCAFWKKMFTFLITKTFDSRHVLSCFFKKNVYPDYKKKHEMKQIFDLFLF